MTTTTTPDDDDLNNNNMKRLNIALIGSSGGGTATLGHTDPTDFIKVVERELKQINRRRPPATPAAEGGNSKNNVVVGLSKVIFVSLSNGKGMDSITNNTEDETNVDAILYYSSNLLSSSSSTTTTTTENNDNNADDSMMTVMTRNGSLKEINQLVQQIMEVKIANDIKGNKIHGLISVSCKPSLFHQTLTAASNNNIPLVGTGGSSLSLLASTALYKVRLIGNSGGSVATTTVTKAISFSSAFAREWNLPYIPWKKKSSSQTSNNNNNDEGDEEGNSTRIENNTNTSTAEEAERHFPGWRSVLNSCLPAFWGVVLLKRILTTLSKRSLLLDDRQQYATPLLSMLENYALPICCSVVMASQYCSKSSSSSTSPGTLIGSVLAASSCQRTVLGGLLAGWLVSILEEKILHILILNLNAPATMTNLVSTGMVGIVVAVILIPVSQVLRMSTDFYRNYLIYSLTETRDEDFEENIRIVALCSLGSVFCYGSKIGWYHSIFLPLILIEMETGNASILGTIDFLTLVLVSAGICAGAIIATKRRRRRQINNGTTTDGGDNANLLKRGLTINLLCGDFIEVCYPLMEDNVAISLSGYVASSISTSILSNDCKSSAYLPFPVSIWLADDWKRLSLACFCASGIPFIVTLFTYEFGGGQKQQHNTA